MVIMSSFKAAQTETKLNNMEKEDKKSWENLNICVETE